MKYKYKRDFLHILQRKEKNRTASEGDEQLGWFAKTKTRFEEKGNEVRETYGFCSLLGFLRDILMMRRNERKCRSTVVEENGSMIGELLSLIEVSKTDIDNK